MNRLTKRDNKGWYIDDQSVYYDEKRRGKVVDRLAAYEDTGLEPEDLEAGKFLFKWLKENRGCLFGAKVRLCEILEAEEEGRLATWPQEVWKVKENPRSNDWNDETEYHIVHYFVHAYEPETGRYFVNLDALPGKKHRHWIKGDGLLFSREEAKKSLKEQQNENT